MLLYNSPINAFFAAGDTREAIHFLLNSIFHPIPKIHFVLPTPHYHTVMWICCRCLLPFGIINIMHPIPISISR